MNPIQKKYRNRISLITAIIWGIIDASGRVWGKYSISLSLKLGAWAAHFIIQAFIGYWIFFFTITFYQKLCDLRSKK